MLRYIVRRLLQMIPILFGITLITFLIINAAGSPLQNMEFNPRVKPEDIERIRRNLGLDDPVWKRYFIWVSHVLRGDLGLSLINFRPVTERIQEVMFNTLLLSSISITLSLLIAVPLGVYAATHRNGYRRSNFEHLRGGWLRRADRLAGLVAHHHFLGAVREMGIPVASGGRGARPAGRG